MEYGTHYKSWFNWESIKKSEENLYNHFYDGFNRKKSCGEQQNEQMLRVSRVVINACIFTSCPERDAQALITAYYGDAMFGARQLL